MQRHRRDLRVMLRHLRCVQQVRELRLSVSLPSKVVGHISLHLIEHNRRRWRQHMATRRQPDSPDIRAWLLCGLQQSWQKEFGEQSVANVVSAELDFVALLRLTRWRGHDSGVQEEDIQARLLGGEGTCCFLDRLQVGQIEFEELDSGIWLLLLQLLNSLQSLLLSSGGAVDFGWVVLSEHADGLATEANIAWMVSVGWWVVSFG